MKQAEIKVGGRGVPAIKVLGNLAENVEDAIALSRNNPAVLVRCFNRGLRIEYQEKSGARDALKEGKSQTEVQALVTNYDPTAVAARTRKPKEAPKLRVAKGQKFTFESLKALAAAQGIVIEEEAPATA
jgi:hypothetical protein